MVKRTGLGFSLACVLASFSATATVIETTRIVGFGEAKYAEDFKHFDYVNPDAPKFGHVTYSATGTFDSFNRFASRGDAAQDTVSIYDPLFVSPSDEIDSYYPLIAERARYKDDYSWMEIDINPNARFHDGKPITAHDVEFTHQKFWDQGVSFYKTIYKDVKSVKALNDKTVRIELNKPDREVLLRFAKGTVVLPTHYWQDKDFSEPLTTPPLGSSAYKITDYKMGQSVTYELVEDYWAKDLPVNVGRNNFKSYSYDYYRDQTVQLEAFKAGEFDVRIENVAKFWANSYTGVNFDKGYIKKEEIGHEMPARMQSFTFNVQKDVFSDPRVREAVNYGMDFEWMNKNLFYSQYARLRSHFQNTPYEAKGLPSPEELAILDPFKDQLPERVFTEEFQPNVTDGSGRIRGEMRKAIAILKEAGWELKDKVMTNVETGEPLTFELLAYQPTTERIAIPMQKNLKRMGIDMKIRIIDSTQFLKRMRDLDYDMVAQGYSTNVYPSPSLQQVWHSDFIDSTYNRAGVKNPVIDSLVEQIVKNQQNPEQLIHLGRALDRVLQWNFFVVPNWFSNTHRVATWDKFERPAIKPKYGLGTDTWWVSEEKAAKLPEKRR